MHFSEQNNANESNGHVDVKDIQGEVKDSDNSTGKLIKDANHHGPNQYQHAKAKTIRLEDTRTTLNNNPDLTLTKNNKSQQQPE